MNSLSVAGRYVIDQVAGSGGMARVWRADDARGHGRVAIKRILDELKGDAEVRAMFDDEAAITASIAHPNVVSLLDRGVDAEGPWLALEWVDGLNAHEIVATRKAPLGVRAALSLGVDLLHALAATHGPGVGVIHRDVAPSNVLVGLDGVARLADYGLARSIARARVNAAGTAKGKIGYLPPEVLRGSIHGTRGDLYGAGAVLWELLAGRRLFAGVTSKSTLAHAYLYARRPSLESVNPCVPLGVASVIDSALSVDPAKRPPSALAMAERLLVAAEQEGVSPSPGELSVAVWGARRAIAGADARRRAELVRATVAAPRTLARTG